MNIPELVDKVRIPELGPSLGKLVVGFDRASAGLPVDGIRERMTNRIFTASGEARRLAATGNEAAAFEAVGPAVWQGAWDEAVSEVADLVVHEVNRHLEAEARAVRMTRRRARRFAVTEAEHRALASRLGARGAHLVPALEALERHAAAAQGEAWLAPAPVAAWQQALVLSARRLEAAWLDLEVAVGEELAHWRQVADDIARWRRSLWPVVLVGAVATAVAVWLGLVMGGYVESPDWLSALWRRVFPR